MPNTVWQLLESWMGGVGKHKVGKIWRMVPYAIMQSLWRERNSRTFEDEEGSFENIKSLCLNFLIEWAAAHSYILW